MVQDPTCGHARQAMAAVVLKPMLEKDFQRFIHKRLEREGWTVQAGVSIRSDPTRPRFQCRVDLIARKPRRLLLIEAKPNWPGHRGIGQLLYYWYLMKHEGKSDLPKDLVLAAWRNSPPFDVPLMEACYQVGVRLWLFSGNYRCFTMKRIGSSWQYLPLDSELAPARS